MLLVLALVLVLVLVLAHRDPKNLLNDKLVPSGVVVLHGGSN